MNNIIDHILYLLPQWQCVTLPGLGALMTANECASFKADGVLCPPASSVLFNPHIVHNDGLLERSVARRCNVPVAEARQMVAIQVDSIMETLQRGEPVEIGRLGSLMSDDSGEVCFRNASSQSWLPALQLTPVMQMAREDMLRENQRSAVAERSGAGIFLRGMRIAASVAVLLALGFVVSTPTPMRDAQYASPMLEHLTPRMAQTAPVHEAADYVIEIKAVADPQGCIRNEERPTPIATTTGEKAAVVAKPTPQAKTVREPSATPLRMNDSDPYCLVIASLNSAEEARQFIGSHGGRLGIHEADGRYRVYACTGRSTAEVRRQGAEHGLTARYRGAWVCTR